jgi:hypothetical protein
VARNVAMRIGQEFSSSCFGINLGEFDIVLGMDYLWTLGPSCGTLRTSACPSDKATAPSSRRAWAPLVPTSCRQRSAPSRAPTSSHCWTTSSSCKFVGGRGTNVRITEATEHTKLRIIRYGAMEELVRDLVADERGRAPVQQVGCCSQRFSPVGGWHGSVDH